MHAPPFLKAGSRIALAAPARKISRQDISSALQFIEQNQWIPVFSDQLFDEFHQWSGTDQQRANYLQSFLDSPEIDLIWCVRGGYGCLRMMDFLNWEKFKLNPKWLLGFSDITALSQHIVHALKGFTIHGPMAINIGKNFETDQRLAKTLMGHLEPLTSNAHVLNRIGKTGGILHGGNLSLIYALQSSSADFIPDGSILFLEDLDEYLYHIDRMMLSLRRSGKLARLSGLVLGGFTDMKDHQIPLGFSAEEIILNAVRDYDFPVCFSLPAGHVDLNFPLLMGCRVNLSVSHSGGVLDFIYG